MPMRLRDSRRYIRRLCADALLVAIALLLSYIEILLPIQILIPLPGVRLGLANLAVMMTFFAVSPIDAAVVSTVRITLMAILFGSPVSFVFSLCGALLSYCGLCFLGRILGNGKISFVGVSSGAAVLHGCGQTIAAMLIYTPAAISYLPLLMCSGIVTGIVLGFVTNLIFGRIEALINVRN